MTDRLLMNSQELRAEGEDLDGEIVRHARAMYERIRRMEDRLHAELAQLDALRRRFEWSIPGPATQQIPPPQQGQRIRAVEANREMKEVPAR